MVKASEIRKATRQAMDERGESSQQFDAFQELRAACKAVKDAEEGGVCEDCFDKLLETESKAAVKWARMMVEDFDETVKRTSDILGLDPANDDVQVEDDEEPTEGTKDTEEKAKRGRLEAEKKFRGRGESVPTTHRRNAWQHNNGKRARSSTWGPSVIGILCVEEEKKPKRAVRSTMKTNKEFVR